MRAARIDCTRSFVQTDRENNKKLQPNANTMLGAESEFIKVKIAGRGAKVLWVWAGACCAQDSYLFQHPPTTQTAWKEKEEQITDTRE